MRALATALALCAAPAVATEEAAFVEANILGIFYHELGHALIDIEGVPIFGQEEDAADTFSILLIETLFEPEVAEELAYDAALGFWAEAMDRRGDVPWWDVHGPDEQRFYNTVCLFYGADPDGRAAFAKDLDLPEERAETCEEEFDQAMNAWGAILDDLASRDQGGQMYLDGGDGSLTAQIVDAEIDALNDEFKLSEDLTVTIESCGEANAFYDPNTVEIIMCSEFEDHLTEIQNRL